VGFYPSDGHAGRGTPDIDRTEEKRIKTYRRECTGSALVSMEVGIRAELGSAEMSMLARAALSARRGAVMELVWGSLARPPNGPRSSRPMATAATLSFARRAARDRHAPPLTGVGHEASKPRERPTRTRSARDARKTLTKRVRGVSRNPLRPPGPLLPRLTSRSSAGRPVRRCH
jgi:hypothetical protein